MTREDIIRMALEANILSPVDLLESNQWRQDTIRELERFASLVRADESEKYKWDVHSCGPTCQRYVCVAMREAVEAEREACAKVCESYIAEGIGREMAEAIRARSKP